LELPYFIKLLRLALVGSSKIYFGTAYEGNPVPITYHFTTATALALQIQIAALIFCDTMQAAK
jgi:hypothetical protein